MNAVHRRHRFIILGLHSKGCWGFAGCMQVRRQLLDLFGAWIFAQNVLELHLAFRQRPDDWIGKYSEIRRAAGSLNGALRGWTPRIEMLRCLRR
jgi:hypothetical protein